MFDEREGKGQYTIGDTIALEMDPSPLAKSTHLVSAPPLRPSFATVIDDIWRRKFTGRFTVDCQSGVPRVIEFPPDEPPMRIRLDTEQKEARN